MEINIENIQMKLKNIQKIIRDINVYEDEPNDIWNQLDAVDLFVEYIYMELHEAKKC